jgi:hypothetical protein
MAAIYEAGNSSVSNVMTACMYQERMNCTLLHKNTIPNPVGIIIGIGEDRYDALPVTLVSCVFLEVHIVHDPPGTIAVAIPGRVVRRDVREWFPGDVGVQCLLSLPCRLWWAVIAE